MCLPYDIGKMVDSGNIANIGAMGSSIPSLNTMDESARRNVEQNRERPIA